tara:strand:- start:688 stop:1038 length:351 start_codon:yes stop_codon:yes gene_type:complete
MDWFDILKAPFDAQAYAESQSKKQEAARREESQSRDADLTTALERDSAIDDKLMQAININPVSQMYKVKLPKNDYRNLMQHVDSPRALEEALAQKYNFKRVQIHGGLMGVQIDFHR